MKLKNIKLNKVIYPVLSGLFFLAVVVVFIYAVRFLSANIKRVFDIDIAEAESHLVRLDMESFYKVAKKLNLQLNQQQTTNDQQQEAGSGAAASESDTVTAAATSTPETISAETATSTSTATTTLPAAPLPPDKSLVKISVLNGTKTAGLAGDLKNALAADGWTVANTGNAPTTAQTVIKIKTSKNNYASLIRESVAKKYALAADQPLSESEEYDIIVVIGK